MIVLAVFVGDVFVELDTAYAYLSGRLFVPIMAALFWRKATWRGALAAISSVPQWSRRHSSTGSRGRRTGHLRHPLECGCDGPGERVGRRTAGG